MEAIAKTRHLKGSPRKARLVIDLIRGRNVSQALAILKFTDKRAADPIAKTLRSAIANATYLAEQQNIAIDPDDLWVKTCFVDMGAHKNRRRMRPAPQGRAYKEQRHYCHITILVTSDEQPKKDIKESKKGKEGDKSSGEKTIKTSAKTNAENAEKKNPVIEANPAKAKEAKVEEVETTATKATVETAEENSPTKMTPKEAVAEQESKNEAEIADAKDATSQTPAEKNATQPADEKQQDINEELERQ
ncbi:MAG: 50S ribosomal protein L22 [Acidobacteriota bacterium]|nr:50S ribosomal protein L22 [Acidobacteriota bacterium]